MLSCVIWRRHRRSRENELSRFPASFVDLMPDFVPDERDDLPFVDEKRGLSFEKGAGVRHRECHVLCPGFGGQHIDVAVRQSQGSCRFSTPLRSGDLDGADGFEVVLQDHVGDS